MDEQFFVSVLTEHHMPVLQRFLMILKRKSFQLEMIWVSETKTSGLYCISATIRGLADKLENLCCLVEKQIDVLAVHGFAGQLNPKTVFISGKANGNGALHSSTPVRIPAQDSGKDILAMLNEYLNDDIARY